MANTRKPVARKAAVPARTATAAKATAKVAAAPAPKVASTGAAVNWDALPEAEDAPAFIGVVTRRVDVEADTPDFIKKSVIDAYNRTMTNGGRVVRNQPCITPENAASFLKQAHRYAKFRNMTVKGRILSDSDVNTLIQMELLNPRTASGSVVSFSVADYEARARKA